MSVDDCTINICFHGVGKPGRALDPGEDQYWIDVDPFLRILDAVRTWPSARLSFDDANASDVRIVLPALIERALTADFFVLAGRLGEPGCLDEDEVRQLSQNDMGIGTHGTTHCSWRRMDPATAYSELIDARERIAAVAGAQVNRAACPFGAYNRRLLADLRRLGYTEVFTSDRRLARPGDWLQPRFSVQRDETAATLYSQVLASQAMAMRLRASAVGAAKRWR